VDEITCRCRLVGDEPAIGNVCAKQDKPSHTPLLVAIDRGLPAVLQQLLNGSSAFFGCDVVRQAFLSDDLPPPEPYFTILVVRTLEF
jgi:hypothetical protein